jgi:hypothetical protein
MANSTPWTTIEAQVFQRLGSLKSSTSPTAETRFKQVPKVADLDDDAAYPPISVRQMIVDTVVEVIGFICKTEGDPRRSHYKIIATLANGDLLPTSMGPYGAIYDPATKRSLVERSASDIADILEAKALGAIPTASKFYFYAMDGDKIYHSLTTSIELEYFDQPTPGTNFAAVDGLFASQVSIAPIPDELAIVVADGAAGRSCMKAAGLIEEGARFLDAYVAGLRERGLNATPPDYAPQPRS